MPNCPIFAFLVAKGFVFVHIVVVVVVSDPLYLVVWLLRATVLSSYIDEIEVIKDGAMLDCARLSARPPAVDASFLAFPSTRRNSYNLMSSLNKIL